MAPGQRRCTRSGHAAAVGGHSAGIDRVGRLAPQPHFFPDAAALQLILPAAAVWIVAALADQAEAEGGDGHRANIRRRSDTPSLLPVFCDVIKQRAWYCAVGEAASNIRLVAGFPCQRFHRRSTVSECWKDDRWEQRRRGLRVRHVGCRRQRRRVGLHDICHPPR